MYVRDQAHSGSTTFCFVLFFSVWSQQAASFRLLCRENALKRAARCGIMRLKRWVCRESEARKQAARSFLVICSALCCKAAPGQARTPQPAQQPSSLGHCAQQELLPVELSAICNEQFPCFLHFKIESWFRPSRTQACTPGYTKGSKLVVVGCVCMCSG